MPTDFRSLASRGLIAAATPIRPIAIQAVWWLAEYTPIVGQAATRRRRWVVLAPYVRTNSLSGALLKLVSIPLLVIACLLYGFFFGLTAPFLLVPFAIPIALLTAFIIWALPDQRSAPTLPIEFLFPAFLVILVLWPRYLAITLPGMPWITLQRILGLPMALLLLICLSMSKVFRKTV